MSYYIPMTWSLFKTEEEKINPTLAPDARPVVQEMTPEKQIYNQNFRTLTNVGIGGYDPRYAEAILTDPSYAITKQKMIDSGLLAEVPKTAVSAMAYTPPSVPVLKNLNPDVQEVLGNLGIQGKGTEDLSKGAATAATSGMDYMNLLKILAMVQGGGSKTSTPKITPGITPAVAGAKIQDEDLYARYRR